MKSTAFYSILFLSFIRFASNAQLLWYADPKLDYTESFSNLNTEPNEKGTIETVKEDKHGKVWQVNKPSSSKRAELSRTKPKSSKSISASYIPAESDIVCIGYQWRVKIEGNEPRKSFAVFQNKSENTHSQNYHFNLDYDGEKLMMNAYVPGEGSQKSRGTQVWIKSISENEWVSIIMGVKFSRDPAIGSIELRING